MVDKDFVVKKQQKKQPFWYLEFIFDLGKMMCYKHRQCVKHASFGNLLRKRVNTPKLFLFMAGHIIISVLNGVIVHQRFSPYHAGHVYHKNDGPFQSDSSLF